MAAPAPDSDASLATCGYVDIACDVQRQFTESLMQQLLARIMKLEKQSKEDVISFSSPEMFSPHGLTSIPAPVDPLDGMRLMLQIFETARK